MDIVDREIPLYTRSVPGMRDGYVMVPREPTEEMLKAGIRAALIKSDELADCYRAMLSASPKQEDTP